MPSCEGVPYFARCGWRAQGASSMSGQLKVRGIKYVGNSTYSIRVRARSPLTGEMENAKKRVRGTLTDAIRVRDELKELLKKGKPEQRKERLRVEDYAKW